MTPVARRLRTAFVLALSVALLSGWRSTAAQSNPSPAPAQSPGASQQPPGGRGGQPFRAGVELVSLNVTVNEAGSNRYATDLEPEQFEVFEDGVKQEVTY